MQAKTEAELRAGNGTVIPRGSVVKGHVIEAAARSKGEAQSSLGIAFDSIALKNGQELPLKASIQAVGAAPNSSLTESQPPMGTPTAPGAAAGGTNQLGREPVPAGYPAPPPTSVPSGQQNASPGLTPQSTGIVGLRNLQLQSNSTIVSSGKDLKLDAGTELMLRVQNQ